MKYKIGEYVKIISCPLGSGAEKLIGKIGKITYIKTFDIARLPYETIYQIAGLDFIWREKELEKAKMEEVVVQLL